MSPIAFFFSASSTNTHCQPCELEPVGACSASSRHSISTSRPTGLSKSRRLRTERVVVRTSSTDRLRVMGGGYIRPVFDAHERRTDTRGFQQRRPRPLRSGWGRRRLIGRNRPGAATRRWRSRERFVAADAVVVELGADYPGFHPLVPKRPVGVLVAVAHGQIAVTPSTTRAEALRHVRLVRVRRISAGNRGRKNKRRSTTQYRSAMASTPEYHFDSPKTLNQYSRFKEYP